MSTHFPGCLFFKNNAFIGQKENKGKLVKHFFVFILLLNPLKHVLFHNRITSLVSTYQYYEMHRE